MRATYSARSTFAMVHVSSSTLFFSFLSTQIRTNSKQRAYALGLAETVVMGLVSVSARERAPDAFCLFMVWMMNWYIRNCLKYPGTGWPTGIHTLHVELLLLLIKSQWGETNRISERCDNRHRHTHTHSPHSCRKWASTKACNVKIN